MLGTEKRKGSGLTTGVLEAGSTGALGTWIQVRSRSDMHVTAPQPCSV